jgi:hypothetical protein
VVRIKNKSRIEVLSSAAVNKLQDEGRTILQIAPGSTPGYFMVEHIATEELLKGEDSNDQWSSDQKWD